MARLVLAATLSANYGIYGPAYELLEHEPRIPAARSTSTPRSTSCAPGTSTIRNSLAPFIARVNRIRREQPGAAATTGTCASCRSITTS